MPDETRPASEGSSTRSLIDVLRALSRSGRGAERYEAQDEIARGGMGSIHRVWDRELRRPLAMKRYLGELPLEDSSAGEERPATESTVDPRVARFVEEAQITGQLDHPGIVPVHEIGLDDEGRLFFTMRLVDGHTLGDVLRMRREGSEHWTDTRVLRTLVRVCEAVAYAHSRGVVHRDLKPANIMVGQFGEVYVMDWGLAKVMGTEERPAAERRPAPAVRSDRSEEATTTADSHLLTLEGNVLGTPATMPPEQARGRHQDVGPRSDVYAIGAILYEYLCGCLPYTGDGDATAHGVLKAVLDGPPTPVRELNPDAPEELVAACEKAMARAPEDRFADSLELADALGRYFERPVLQARAGLQRSRLVTVTQWGLGCATILLGTAVVLVTALVVLGMSSQSVVSLSLPLAFEIDAPNYSLSSDQPWIQGVDLHGTSGELLIHSGHWLAKATILAMIFVVLGFMLFVIHQARRILSAVRRGEPFAADNLVRIRRVGYAIALLGILRMLQSPLMGRVAEKVLTVEGLTLKTELDIPWMEMLGVALIFILAEVFRVGMELEKRTG